MTHSKLSLAIALILLSACDDTQAPGVVRGPEIESGSTVPATSSPPPDLAQQLPVDQDARASLSDNAQAEVLELWSVGVRCIELESQEGLEIELGVSHKAPRARFYGPGTSVNKLRLEGPEAHAVLVPVLRPGEHLWARVLAPGQAQLRVYGRPDRTTGAILIELQRKPGATLRGHLRTEDAEPLLEGKLKARIIGQRVHGQEVFADGAFEVHYQLERDGAEGWIEFDGWERGCGRLGLEGLTQARPPQDLNLWVRGSGELLGTLSDGQGRALAGIPMRLATAEWFEQWQASWVQEGYPHIANRALLGAQGRTGASFDTDAEGKFHLSGLSPGKYVVVAMSDGGEGYERLHAGLLSTGPLPVELVLETQRLSVRLRLPDGGYASFDPYMVFERGDHGGRLVALDKYFRVGLWTTQPLNRPRKAWQVQGQAPGFDTVRWFETGDPTRWELGVRLDVPYTLRAMTLNRAPVSMPVQLSRGSGTLQVELQLGLEQAPGHLHLSLSDVAGMERVRAFKFTLIPDAGGWLEDGWELQRKDLGPGESWSRQLDLPAGGYSVRLVPVPKRKGDANLPGPAEGHVQLLGDEHQWLLLECAPGLAISGEPEEGR